MEVATSGWSGESSNSSLNHSKKIRDRFTIRSYICIEYLATFSSKILETDVKMCPFYILIIFLCIYYNF